MFRDICITKYGTMLCILTHLMHDRFRKRKLFADVSDGLVGVGHLCDNVLNHNVKGFL